VITAIRSNLDLLSPGFSILKPRFLKSVVTFSARPAVLVPFRILILTSSGSSGSVTLASGAPSGQPSSVTTPPWVSRTSATTTKTIAATASTPITTSARTRAKLMGPAPGGSP
jgi:hypothetical protein